MITFSKFGRHGRLGNQLFQLASVIGFATKYNHKPCLPDWVYSKYFKGVHPGYQPAANNMLHPVKEAAFHFTPEYYEPILNQENKNFDLFGYFQSEKYWQHCIEQVTQHLKFKPEFKDRISKQYSFIFKKKTIAVSIRRGDFVNNANYHQLPIAYYVSALEKHFPEWRKMNLVFFSDDIDYCKLHFGCLDNAFFTSNKFKPSDRANYWNEDTSAIEQLCLGSMCDNFILSNSTFSWWMAYLGETSKSIVLRPKATFSGNLSKNNDTKDFYPSRWIIHEEEKIDLSDVTFMIPVSYDHPDRKQNLDLNVCMLQKYFNTNIIVCENMSNKFEYFTQYGCRYIKYHWMNFHRTRMLNNMAIEAQTPIIVNWDADVFVSPVQFLFSVEKIRKGEADVVYPYDGRFARVQRIPHFKNLESALDVGIFSAYNFPGTFASDKKSVGGAIIFNKEKYFEGGGETKSFVSYGPEDVERALRFERLGYKIFKTPGIIHHIDHWRGHDSKSHGNKFYKQNHDEMDKVDSFRGTGLREYVNTWPQTKKI